MIRAPRAALLAWRRVAHVATRSGAQLHAVLASQTLARIVPVS